MVILFSDHGPDVRLNWGNPADPGLHDRVSNFFAARTPGKPSLFPDDITLVNVIPILFNSYYGMDLPTPVERCVHPGRQAGWAAPVDRHAAVAGPVDLTLAGTGSRVAIASGVWYPAALALAWALQSPTRYALDPLPSARSIVALTLGAGFVSLVACLAMRDRAKGSALAGVLVVGALVGSTRQVAALFIGAALLLVVEFALERRGRVRLPWQRIHEAAALTAAVLLLIQVVTYGWVLVGRPRPVFGAAWDAPIPAPASRPDIVVIVVDGHGRPDILREHYGYDSSPFVRALGQLGFDVAASSRANYLDTLQSLPVVLVGEAPQRAGIGSRP